jgi:hypothetical protein
VSGQSIGSKIGFAKGKMDAKKCRESEITIQQDSQLETEPCSHPQENFILQK